ncbi:MAG: hypothetical protein Q7S61_02225 [bacterium]|nr:hypothetical protein [bacterium]
MMDQKCCGDCDNCSCSQEEDHDKMKLDCCEGHSMSKEHLEAKKKKLEEKLKWVNEELGKK